MSEEQLKAFIEKVKGDTSLQEKLKAEGADPIAIAKVAGFTIKQQDLLRQASELSDEELESVTGGLTPTVKTVTFFSWGAGLTVKIGAANAIREERTAKYL